MTFIESLAAEAAQEASQRNGEVVLEAFKTCLSNEASREIASSLMRRLSPTCEYRKARRSLNKWARRKQAIEDRAALDWWTKPSRPRANCVTHIGIYTEKLKTLNPCGGCISCRISEFKTCDEHNRAVRREAAEVAADIKNLINPILSL